MTRPWYPFFWGDYSAKTHHLTQGQHGAYIMLLRYTYTSGEPVPDELRFSIARATLEQERSDTDFVLNSFFTLEDGLWRNERALRVMAEAEVKHQARVLAGEKGGKQKSSNARAKLKPSSSNHNHNHKASTEGKPSSEAEGLSVDLPEWLPLQTWEAFVAMRRSLGKDKALSDEAAKRIIAKLGRLRQAGHDPEAVLDESIISKWAGVFPLKTKAGGDNAKSGNRHGGFDERDYSPPIGHGFSTD